MCTPGADNPFFDAFIPLLIYHLDVGLYGGK